VARSALPSAKAAPPSPTAFGRPSICVRRSNLKATLPPQALQRACGSRSCYHSSPTTLRGERLPIVSTVSIGSITSPGSRQPPRMSVMRNRGDNFDLKQVKPSRALRDTTLFLPALTCGLFQQVLGRRCAVRSRHGPRGMRARRRAPRARGAGSSAAGRLVAASASETPKRCAQGREGAGGASPRLRRRPTARQKHVNPTGWLCSGPSEQAALHHLEAVGLQGREQEEQPISDVARDSSVERNPACRSGFSIEAPRGHMRRGTPPRRAGQRLNSSRVRLVTSRNSWGRDCISQNVQWRLVVPLSWGHVYHNRETSMVDGECPPVHLRCVGEGKRLLWASSRQIALRVERGLPCFVIAAVTSPDTPPVAVFARVPICPGFHAGRAASA